MGFKIQVCISRGWHVCSESYRGGFKGVPLAHAPLFLQKHWHAPFMQKQSIWLFVSTQVLPLFFLKTVPPPLENSWIRLWFRWKCEIWEQHLQVSWARMTMLLNHKWEKKKLKEKCYSLAYFYFIFLFYEYNKWALDVHVLYMIYS